MGIVNFKGIDQDGEPIDLADYRGKWVALYFYPKDDTPGCTAQACNLKENFSSLKKENIEVIGVSLDSVESHKKFQDKYALPFRLIADHDRRLSKQLGIYKWHFGFNFFPYKWIKRTTVLIDPNGFERDRIEDVAVHDHANQILKKIKTL